MSLNDSDTLSTLNKLIIIDKTSEFNTSLLKIDIEHFTLNLIDNLNIDKLKNIEKYNGLIDYIISRINECIESSKENYNCDKFSVIFDLEKAKISQIDYKFIKTLINKLNSVYPDNLNGIYLNNTSKIVKIVYNIIKKLIDKDTRDKIHFH